MSASLFQSSLLRAAPDRAEFAPPKPPGMLRALLLAMLAHGLLVVGLTWGVHWKQQPDNRPAVDAELWSSVPQQAAPEAVEPPPPPPQPEPPQAKPRPAPPATRDADIAVARQKKLAEEREAEERRLADLARKAADDKKRQANKEEAQRQKEAARQEASRAAKAAIEREMRRLANLQRMAGMAGATGGDTANGNAQRSAGPSAGYGNRIRARIKPNIVFAEEIAGNPTAEVEVRLAPDGMIISRRIVKSSGVKDWDEAVLKAIDKTEMLPKDTDGRVPQEMLISFRPKD